jgi:hypothetical protein
VGAGGARRCGGGVARGRSRVPATEAAGGRAWRRRRARAAGARGAFSLRARRRRRRAPRAPSSRASGALCVPGRVGVSWLFWSACARAASRAQAAAAGACCDAHWAAAARLVCGRGGSPGMQQRAVQALGVRVRMRRRARLPAERRTQLVNGGRVRRGGAGQAHTRRLARLAASHRAGGCARVHRWAQGSCAAGHVLRVLRVRARASAWRGRTGALASASGAR